jgi:hypothetical protein
MVLRKANGFELAELEGIEIVVADELGGYMGRPDLLKLLEGGSMAINPKHGNPRTIHFSGRIVVSSNDDAWVRGGECIGLGSGMGDRHRLGYGNYIMPEDTDPAIAARAAVYRVNSLPEASPEARDKICREETPWIVLLLASVVFQHKGGVRDFVDDPEGAVKVYELYDRIGYLGLTSA